MTTIDPNELSNVTGGGGWDIVKKVAKAVVDVQTAAICPAAHEVTKGADATRALYRKGYEDGKAC